MHLVVIDGAIASSGEGLTFHPARLDPEDSKALREAIRLEVFALTCPHCGTDMRIIALIEAPQSIRRILGAIART